MNKSKAAFEFSAQKLGKEKLFFWTFTFAEVLSVKDTRKKWNHLLTLLRRRYPKLCGLRAFELHEEHGLHVHLVTNAWINVNEARVMAMQAGWGRIHVKRIPAAKAGYLGKYLSKEHRAPCFKGWRLWASFGSWEWTKIKDVEFSSDYGKVIKGIITLEDRPQSHFSRLTLADKLYLESLKNS
jgi:hypothetical protein